MCCENIFFFSEVSLALQDNLLLRSLVAYLLVALDRDVGWRRDLDENRPLR